MTKHYCMQNMCAMHSLLNDSITLCIILFCFACICSPRLWRYSPLFFQFIKLCSQCVNMNCSNQSSHSDFRALPDTARFLDSAVCCFISLTGSEILCNPSEKRSESHSELLVLHRACTKSSLSIIQMVRGRDQTVGAFISIQCSLESKGIKWRSFTVWGFGALVFQVTKISFQLPLLFKIHITSFPLLSQSLSSLHSTLVSLILLRCRPTPCSFFYYPLKIYPRRQACYIFIYQEKMTR